MCVVCIVLPFFFFFFSVTPRHRSHSAWIQLACKLYTYLCWNNWEFTLAHVGAPIMFYGLPARFIKESRLLALNRKSVNSDNVVGSTKFTVRDEFPTNSFVSTWTPLPHVFIYHFFFVFLCDSSHEPSPSKSAGFFIGHDESITAGTYLCPNSFIGTLVSVSAQVLTNCHYSMHWLGFRKFNVLPWYQMILAGLSFTKNLRVSHLVSMRSTCFSECKVEPTVALLTCEYLKRLAIFFF